MVTRKRIPLATKRAVQSNRSAITRVKNMMYGSLQKSLVRLDQPGLSLQFDADRPLLFAVDDFTRFKQHVYNGGRVYQKGIVTGTIDARSSWITTTPAAASPFHEWTDDEVGGGKYKLVSNRMTFTFQSSGNDEGLQDCYIKVQIVKQKFNRFTASHDDQVFPDGLLYLTNLARPEVGNNLPVKYFNVLQERRCYINSKKTGDTKGTTGDIKRCNMAFAPKGGQLIRQLDTYPTVQGATNNPVVPEIEGGWYGPGNRGGGTITWCIVSTNHVNNDPVNPTGPVMSCTQLRSWHDSVGAY